MLQSLWNEYGTEALMALGGAFRDGADYAIEGLEAGRSRGRSLVRAPVSGLHRRLRSGARRRASVRRVRALCGVAVAASLALAVTINGRASLFSRSYVLSFCVALVSGLALWALYAVMLHHYGIDLLAPGHAKS